MNEDRKYAFMIAAPRSNSGKTLITLGLIRSLRNKGYAIQAYKCGPDYIDPMHHKMVSGRASYNLDTWMDSPYQVKNTFINHLLNADIGIAEGVMGFFDGAEKDSCSSAEIARLLDLPVVLIVDASSMAYSVAPLLYGFKNFDPGVKLAGVIFNKTGSESHVHILEEGAKDAGVEVLGYVPRDSRLTIESRHLGLHLPGENQDHKIVDAAAELVEKHINLNSLLDICRITIAQKREKAHKQVASPLKFAIAYDKAFNFTYQANLDALSELGETTFFSPLQDTCVPDADLIWLPGGYPELFAKELSANQSMIKSIKAFIENGNTLISECGGMMYLGNTITDKNGDNYTMAGVYNFSATFKNMKLHLGYREIPLTGFSVRGHEFHYSELTGKYEKSIISYAKTALGMPVNMPVFRYKNCWASYMHLYLGNKQKMSDFLNYMSYGK